MSRRVLLVVPELLVLTRIRETARTAGVEVETATSAEAIEACRRQRPDLVVFDLADPTDPFAAAAAIRDDPALAGIPLIGFYPHVDASLRARALAAGIQPLPRSAFTTRLAALLTGAAS